MAVTVSRMFRAERPEMYRTLPMETFATREEAEQYLSRKGFAYQEVAMCWTKLEVSGHWLIEGELRPEVTR